MKQTELNDALCRRIVEECAAWTTLSDLRDRLNMRSDHDGVLFAHVRLMEDDGRLWARNRWVINRTFEVRACPASL